MLHPHLVLKPTFSPVKFFNMKKLTFLLFTAVGIFLAACTNPPAENAAITANAENAAPAPSRAMELTNQFFEVAGKQHNFDALETLLHPNFHSHHYPAPPGSDKAPFIQGIKDMTTAFPDLTITVHDQIAQGDKVFTYFSWTGTHKGAFNGLAPTNKQVKVEGMDIWREQDGQLIENWVVMDIMGLMMQLGAVPPPPAK
jgi:steroid delta-isomerase-like uncharacterized protein